MEHLTKITITAVMLALCACGPAVDDGTSVVAVAEQDTAVDVTVDEYGVPYFTETSPSATLIDGYAKMSCAVAQVHASYYPESTALFFSLGQVHVSPHLDLQRVNQLLIDIPKDRALRRHGLHRPLSLKVMADGTLEPEARRLEQVVAYRRWHRVDQDVDRVWAEMPAHARRVAETYAQGLRKHYREHRAFYASRSPKLSEAGIFRFMEHITAKQMEAARAAENMLFSAGPLREAIAWAVALNAGQTASGAYGKHQDDFPGASNGMAVGSGIADSEFGYSAPHLPSLPWQSTRYASRPAVLAFPDREQSLLGYFFYDGTPLLGGTGNAFWGRTANGFIDVDRFFVELVGEDHYVDYIDGGIKAIVERPFEVAGVTYRALETRFGTIVAKFTNGTHPQLAERIAVVARLPSRALQHGAQQLDQALAALGRDATAFADASCNDLPYWHEVRYFKGQGVDVRSHMGHRPKVADPQYSSVGGPQLPSANNAVVGTHTAEELPHATGQDWGIIHNSPPEHNCGDCKELAKSWPVYTYPTGVTTFRTRQSRRFIDAQAGERINYETFVDHATGTQAEKYLQLKQLIERALASLDAEEPPASDTMMVAVRDFSDRYAAWDGTVRRNQPHGIYFELILEQMGNATNLSWHFKAFFQNALAVTTDAMLAGATSSDLTQLFAAVHTATLRYQTECQANGITTWGDAHKVYLDGVAVATPVGAPKAQRAMGSSRIKDTPCSWAVTWSSPWYTLWNAEADYAHYQPFGGVMTDLGPFFHQTTARVLALTEREGKDAFIRVPLRGQLPQAKLWQGRLTCESLEP